jgi:hypothetical protein
MKNGLFNLALFGLFVSSLLTSVFVTGKAIDCHAAQNADVLVRNEYQNVVETHNGTFELTITSRTDHARRRVFLWTVYHNEVTLMYGETTKFSVAMTQMWDYARSYMEQQ